MKAQQILNEELIYIEELLNESKTKNIFSKIKQVVKNILAYIKRVIMRFINGIVSKIKNLRQKIKSLSKEKFTMKIFSIESVKSMSESNIYILTQIDAILNKSKVAQSLSTMDQILSSFKTKDSKQFEGIKDKLEQHLKLKHIQDVLSETRWNTSRKFEPETYDQDDIQIINDINDIFDDTMSKLETYYENMQVSLNIILKYLGKVEKYEVATNTSDDNYATQIMLNSLRSKYVNEIVFDLNQASRFTFDLVKDYNTAYNKFNDELIRVFNKNNN